MYKLKDETNIDEIVKKISEKNNMSKEAVEEIFLFNANSAIAEKLKVTNAELDAILNGEANFTFHESLNLTQADLDNLIAEYGKEIVIGLLVATLLK